MVPSALQFPNQALQIIGTLNTVVRLTDHCNRSAAARPSNRDHKAQQTDKVNLCAIDNQGNTIIQPLTTRQAAITTRKVQDFDLTEQQKADQKTQVVGITAKKQISIDRLAPKGRAVQKLFPYLQVSRNIFAQCFSLNLRRVSRQFFNQS